MWFRSPPKDLDKCDILLRPYLSARSKRDAATRLEALFKEHIDQIIVAKLKTFFAARNEFTIRDEQQEGFDDVKHMVMVKMLVRLDALREEYQTSHVIQKPIGNLGCYVAAVTSNAWKAYLRKIKPVFYQVYRTARALVANHKADDKIPQMAVWEMLVNGRKVWVGGMTKWQGQEQMSVYSEKLHEILEGTTCEIAEAWDHAFQSAKLEIGDPLSSQGIYALFTWLDHPVTLNTLTVLLGKATRRMDVTTESLEDYEHLPAPPPDAQKSDVITAAWKCVRTILTRRERIAFLLGGKSSSGLSLLESDDEGAEKVSREALAQIMEIRERSLENDWGNLPLEDKRIAELIGCSVQGVADARLSARAKIRKAIADMLPDDE